MRAVRTTALTARRRLDALVCGGVVRLATEVDLTLLGVRAEALIWLAVRPDALDTTTQALSHAPGSASPLPPRVRALLATLRDCR